MSAMYGTPASPDRSGFDVGTVARLGAAIAVFVSGLIHLQLYLDGYRDFPDENLGRSFLLNAIVSVALTIALVVRRELIVRLAAAALLVGTLIAFVLSRTDNGIFGFSESGLNPSPQAALALILEIAGLVLLAATFVPAVGPGGSLPPATAATAGGLAVVLAIVGAVLWAREDTSTASGGAPTTTAAAVPTTTVAETTTTAAGSTTSGAPGASTTEAPSTTAAPTTTVATTAAASTSTTVSIVDFAFDAQTLEVPVGTTVEWVNNDSFAHTVVADDGSFESEDLGTGDRFTFTFTTAGTFNYACGIHPSMLGSIVVTG